MLLTSNERQEVIYLKNRRGFIKFSLEEGLSIVPMYGFGENDVLSFPSNIRLSKAIDCSKRFDFSSPENFVLPFRCLGVGGSL